MPPVGFEPAIPASEQQQNHALDRAATGVGDVLYSFTYFNRKCASRVVEDKDSELNSSSSSMN